MSKVAVVTGGSSGIGLSTAKMLAKEGYIVYELSRHGSGFGPVRHITADVTDEVTLRAAFEAIYEKEGRLDLLVNNAGFGISGAIEFTSVEDVRHLFDVDFLGPLCCIQLALPYLRESRGRIVNVSSMAALAAIPFQAFYSAAKAAVNSVTLALINEVRSFGVTVCAVMPGDVRTGFTAARKKKAHGVDLYGQVIERAVASMERDEKNGMSPDTVAKKIVRVATCSHPRPLYVVGLKYRFLNVLIRFLPVAVATRIIGMMYR